jgi:hypothetical protein
MLRDAGDAGNRAPTDDLAVQGDVMTPARFITELIAGFTGRPSDEGTAALPEAAWLPRDLASAGQLVSGLRTRTERAMQRLLAEAGADGDGSSGADPVVVDGRFLRDHGLALLGAMLGEPGPDGSGARADGARRAYRAYRLDLVSIASDAATWASRAGEDLLRAAGVSDPAAQLTGLVGGLDGLPWRVRDLVGAAGGLVAGLLDAVPEGAGDAAERSGRWLEADVAVRGALEAAGLGAWPDEDDEIDATDAARAPAAQAKGHEAVSGVPEPTEEQGDERS